MAVLNYGNGQCDIDGKELTIKGVEINYSGAVEITSSSASQILSANSRKIIICTINANYSLSKLFTYTGEFKILSVLVGDENGEKVQCVISPNLHLTKMLNSSVDKMTTPVNELNVKFKKDRKITETKTTQTTINNLDCNRWGKNLFLEDGTKYNGRQFHIHLKTGVAMTGPEHSKDSQYLYYKQTNLEGQLIDKLILTGWKPGETMPPNKMQRQKPQ